jgi:hypothetical protein
MRVNYPTADVFCQQEVLYSEAAHIMKVHIAVRIAHYSIDKPMKTINSVTEMSVTLWDVTERSDSPITNKCRVTKWQCSKITLESTRFYHFLIPVDRLNKVQRRKQMILRGIGKDDSV